MFIGAQSPGTSYKPFLAAAYTVMGILHAPLALIPVAIFYSGRLYVQWMEVAGVDSLKVPQASDFLLVSLPFAVLFLTLSVLYIMAGQCIRRNRHAGFILVVALLSALSLGFGWVLGAMTFHEHFRRPFNP